MKKKQLILVYIYSSPQSDHVNLVKVLAKHLDAKYLIHLSRQNLEGDLKSKFYFNSIFSLPLHLADKIYQLLRYKTVQWGSYPIYPYGISPILDRINYYWKNRIIPILIKLCSCRIVILTNYPSRTTIELAKSIDEVVLIGDCTEYWSDSVKKIISSRVNLTLVNNLAAKKNLSKFQPMLVSAGYFEKRTVDKIYKKCHGASVKSRSVLYLGAIDWRINFTALNKAIKDLPTYNFYFLSDLLFDYDLENQNPSFRKKNLKAKAQFEKILAKPNCHFVLTQHHADVIANIGRYSVGIIPYKINTNFYRQVHPVKLYFYLSAGIPVISAPLQMLRESSLVHIYQSADELVKLIVSVSKENVSARIHSDMHKHSVSQSIEMKASQISTALKQYLD